MNTGQMGEQLALQHYLNRGYTLAQANYSTRLGEIDLILRGPDLWVFAEVKTRSRRAIARPGEWVDFRKQKKITATALAYLQANHLGDAPMRFDVVEVWLNDGCEAEINCIENAF